jgi:hypothetical protein
MSNIAEVNQNASRILYEGVNSDGELRRIVYLPYTDGFVQLLLTDSTGNTIDVITAQDISKQYLPETYYNDVPNDYTWGLPNAEDR